MAQLRQDYDQFVSLDTAVLVVGPEDAVQFEKYWEKNALPFVGLPDPEHSVLKRYGQDVSLFRLGRLPAQVTIDRHGRARFVHYGKSMSDIPDNAEIIQLLETLNSEHPTVGTLPDKT